MGSRVYNIDAEMLLKDAYDLTSTAAAQVSSADQILDLGAARFEGVAVIDVSGIEVASTNEIYTVVLQGSNSATFASGIQNLASMDLGAAAVRKGSAGVSLVGRYELPFVNEQADITYRYLRMHITVAGTIDTIGIQMTAFVAEKY